jgi:hypothetical protein
LLAFSASLSENQNITRLKTTAMAAKRMIPLEPPTIPPMPMKSAARPAMITHVRACVENLVRVIDMTCRRPFVVLGFRAF